MGFFDFCWFGGHMWEKVLDKDGNLIGWRCDWCGKYQKA